MPFRFLYFIYYIACRRDQMRMPSIEQPSVTASYGLSFMTGWPVLAFLALLNYLFGWLPPWTHLWVSLHLPGEGRWAVAYSFIAIGVIVAAITYNIIFSKKRYAWIMHEFAAYDPTQRSIAPSVILTLPLIPLGVIAAYAIYPDHNPLIPNLVIWAILIATEIAFRSWWNRWRRRHGMSQTGNAHEPN